METCAPLRRRRRLCISAAHDLLRVARANLSANQRPRRHGPVHPRASPLVPDSASRQGAAGMNAVKVFPAQKRVVIPYRADLHNLLPRTHLVQAGGVPWLAIPHELDAVRVLRNAGYEAPSPIQYDYDWAGGKPFDSQI